MAKTIVNIITDDNPIPAYLFIKEMYEYGDRLMYISAKSTEDDLESLQSFVKNVPAEQIDSIVLRNLDEYAYEYICRTVVEKLENGVDYCVNLAGGTRYMALAVQQVFERFGAKFYYVHVDRNQIVHSIYDDSIYDGDDHFYPIHHRMTIAEYLQAHEIQHISHKPIRPEEESKRFFDFFINKKFKKNDYETLELLREHYRNRKKIDIAETEMNGKGANPPVPHLTALLKKIGFIPAEEGFLQKAELEYLTGGWFEEYVYYLILRNVEPQDIAMGVVISRKDVNTNNELDVVFTKGNKLFVIECKAGIENQSTFNAIVYKACAIREALLGVSCFSYIFSPKQDDDKDTLERIANNMGIKFIDHDVITHEGRLQDVTNTMRCLSKDNPKSKSNPH